MKYSNHATLGVKLFGSWEVSCRLPEIQTTTYGVIGPVATDAQLDEYKDEILNNDPVSKLTKIE